LHKVRLIPPSLLGFAVGGKFTFGEGLGLHVQVDLGVDVRSSQRDMAEPATDCIDVNARTEEVGCGAVHTLQATRDVRKVSLWLGHANLQSTEIYLRADPTEKLEALTAVPPLGVKRGRFHLPDKLLAMLKTASGLKNYAE